MRRIFTSGADQVLAKPPKKLTITVHIALPAPLRGFQDVDPFDVNIMAILSRLGREHEAEIKAEEIGPAVMVTIQAANRTNAKAIVAELRQQLLYRPGDESVWRAQVVINPPSASTVGFRAVLKPMEGTTGRRVTAAPAGCNTPNIDDAGLARAQYNIDLARILDRAAGILKHNPNGMEMRVRFGTLTLDEWKKDKPDYTFAETGTLIWRAGARGTVHMLTSIKDESTQALRRKLVPNNVELPESVRRYLEENAQPARSLIIKTKNLSIEALLEPIAAQAKLGEKKEAEQHKLGALKFSPQEKQHHAAEIITICPESGHDWKVDVRPVASDDGQLLGPFSIQELQKAVWFTGKLRDKFPDITVNTVFRKQYDIQNVYGKTTWKFDLGMTFVLEITNFVELVLTPVQPATTSSTGVVLYNTEWDYEMRASVSIPRAWDQSFAAQFFQAVDPGEVPAGPEIAGPFRFLRRWVDWIQDALDSVEEEEEQGQIGL
ncbi:hypothetical protein N0V88_006685 [Collariella sp. IMI 366227]|nr:hypothetical protein N0V88_006685 [Collariella sp. IMI 366227]